jgi:hypothetical protein
MRKEIAKKVGIWVLAFALFAAHVFFRTVAHAETGSDSTWKKMNAKNNECCISFPSAPQMIQQSLPLADGTQKLNYDVYIAPFEDRGVFLLLIATYPSPLPGGHEMAGLEGLLNGIVGHHPDNQLVFADLTKLGGHPAVNFLVQNGRSYFRGQALMVGNKLYLIAMEGIRDELDEKTFTKFLKSFQLTQK